MRISALVRGKSLAPVLFFIAASTQIASAQQEQAPSPAPQVPAQQAPTQQVQPAQPAPVIIPPSPYLSLQRMIVEANYGGPLADTLIQRLRDPVDGTICYLYLPISVPHGPALEDGIIRYGANPVGSISCLPPQAGAARKK